MMNGSNASRSGITLLEMTVVIVLVGLVTGSTIGILGAMRRMSVTGDAQVDLQREGEEALSRIVQDLRRSGSITITDEEGVNTAYPYLFEPGSAREAFEHHDHEAAMKSAQPNENDFGVNREVVYLLPADVTGPEGVPDGVPDLDANGALIWSDNEMSFVVATREDGRNYLERRTNGGAPERICPHVERLVIDDTISSSFEVPLGAVRVRLFLRKRDVDGIVHRYSGEVTVRLRNG